MQRFLLTRSSRLRSSFALLCMLAVLVVSGVQVAHWDGESGASHTLAKTARNNDGLCPICYSVPVGHGAAPAAIVPVRMESSCAIETVASESAGIQPEFHLHIRPPPSLA